MATIAEVLHYAADYCLWDPGSSSSQGVASPSCHAIKLACERLKVDYDFQVVIFDGLENMGLDTSQYNFFDFRDDYKKQGARYAWLKFAALIAEEQGV